MVRKFPDQGIPTKADSPRLNVTPEETFPSSRHLKWAVTFLLVYFGLRLLFFALTISPSVPPDEVTHFGVSSIFSRVSFLPENSPKTYEYGLVTNIPWLYYWTMGRLLAVNFSGIPDLLFLRLLNIPFAFATIYFVWRTFRLLTDDRLSQILLVVVMTNTIMFTFISASVSYDNLTNLLAAMAVYYLLAFFKTRSGDLLAASFLCQMAGSLTKISFLPLVLILNVLLLIYEFKNLRVLPSVLAAYFKAGSWRRMGLALGILLSLALNIHLYGGNYYHYGSLNPGMSDILSPDKAMQNRLEARSEIFSQFKEGRISRKEALALAIQIGHPGDRADTIYLIENYDALKNNRTELLGPVAYMVFWVQQVSAGIFGIFGHLQMANRGLTMWLFAALCALTCLGILVRWRPSEAAWLPSCLIAIAAFYVLFLLYSVNYRNYLYSGALGLGLQGRYIFPVLGPIYAVSSYYLLRLFGGEYGRRVVTGAVCLLFIASDLPFFLLHVTPDWFAPLFR
jgi:hypothetical protein